MRGFHLGILCLVKLTNNGTDMILHMVIDLLYSVLESTLPIDYHTSDSLWKIWLAESIQSIHNTLWTWHDKCNICCRYCIYHVKFNVCLVTKLLGVFSSKTKWPNASLLFLRMNYVKKCIIKLASADNTDLVFDNSWYHAQPHPIIVY